MATGLRNHDRCACGSSFSSAEAWLAPRGFHLPGGSRVYERDRPFSIEHIALDLVLDMDGGAIDARAELDVVRRDATALELSLDAMAFTDVKVRLVPGGRRRAGRRRRAERHVAADWVYDGKTLRVTLPAGQSRVTVCVSYRAKPQRGLYFVRPDEQFPDRPTQVWSQCQDEDARHFFPCHDKPHEKHTFELSATVPRGFYVLSNGYSRSSLRDQKAGRFHYEMPDALPSYLVTLVVGKFAILEDVVKGGAVDGLPVTYLVPEGREQDGRRTFARTPEMIRRFGELTGVPFPWNKYAQVVVSDFVFGGMENTTATTMYEHILLDEQASLDVTSDDLIAHELAHHWFGDYVTCRDWSHAWLNEGFATLFEHIDREQHRGRDEYEHGLRDDIGAYLTEARTRYRRPIVCQDYDQPIDIFDRHLYEKGGLVLHLLRRELGDDAFWAGVNAYLEHGRGGIVETRDLMRAMENQSGKSLERFFEQWVHRPGHPELKVKIEHRDGVLSVHVRQTQSVSAGAQGPAAESLATPLFSLDLLLDVGVTDTSAKSGQRVTREVRRVHAASHTFAFPASKRPSFVVIDPDLRVLGDVSVEAPVDMLVGQLQHAATARGRVLAAEALGKLHDLQATDALGRVLADGRTFWGLRGACADALGRQRSDAAFAELSSQVRTRHPKVRCAVVEALGNFRTEAAAKCVRPAALRDRSYLVGAAAARALGATRQKEAFDTLVGMLQRPSWRDVIRSAALSGLASLGDERATVHVKELTQYGQSMRVRHAAIMALPKLASDRKTRRLLEDLLDDGTLQLRIAAAKALGDMGDVRARAALNKRLEREVDGQVRRRIREVLRDLTGTARREAQKLRDELDGVRRDHLDMKAKLAELEARLSKPSSRSKRVSSSRARGT